MRRHCERESFEAIYDEPQLFDAISEAVVPLGDTIEGRKLTRKHFCVASLGLLLTACAEAVVEKPKQTVQAVKTLVDWAAATAELVETATPGTAQTTPNTQVKKPETATPIPEQPFIKPKELVSSISPVALNRFDFPGIDLVEIAQDEVSLNWLRQVQGMLRWNQKKTPVRPDWNWTTLRVAGRGKDGSLVKGLWVTAQDGAGKTVGFFSEVPVEMIQDGQVKAGTGLSLAGLSERVLLIDLTAVASTSGGVIGAIQEDQDTGSVFMKRPFLKWQTENQQGLLATTTITGEGSSGAVRGVLSVPRVTQEQGFPPYFLSPHSYEPLPVRAFLGEAATDGKLYQFRRNTWIEEPLPLGMNYVASVEKAPPGKGSRFERVVLTDETGKRRGQMQGGRWVPYQPLEAIFAKGLDYDRNGKTLADGAFNKAQELGEAWPITYRFGRSDWKTGIVGYIQENRPESTLFAVEIFPYPRHLKDGRTVLAFLVRYQTTKGDWQYLARDQERGRDSSFIVTGKNFPFELFQGRATMERAEYVSYINKQGLYLPVPGAFSVKLLQDQALMQPFEAIIDMPTSNPTFRPLLQDFEPYESREVGIKTVGFSRLILPHDLFQRI